MPVISNPFDDARLAKVRAEQGDPIVQYYIVRKDIPMTIGKVCAQVAHGAQIFAFYYASLKEGDHPIDTRLAPVDIIEEWFNGSFRKVVLGGDAKDFEKVKKEIDVFVVRDAGLTEVEAGTETLLVTWPMLKSKQPKFLTKLQTLKRLEDDHVRRH